MKITFDIDVEREKSIVNFEFAENEDNIVGYDVAREALGMMYAELCIKSFPHQDYVNVDSGVFCAKLGFPPSAMPKDIVSDVEKRSFTTTEIKSFFCNETLEVIAFRKGVATHTGNILDKIMGVSDEQNERK